jgi:hypothetical protein
MGDAFEEEICESKDSYIVETSVNYCPTDFDVYVSQFFRVLKREVFIPV